MCKKLGITALVILGALFLFRGLGLLPYAKLACKKMREEAKASVPPELKIQRLRDEIANLGPEMNKQRSAVATEIVEINGLKKNIAEAKARLQEREEQIRTVRAELKANSTFVSIGGEKLSREKVEASLARKWDSFKQAEAAVKSQEELLAAREEALELAKQKLTAMESKKQELAAKVDGLEIELRKVRLAQVKNDVAIDDSQLSNVMKLYDEVDKQIAKEKTELELQKAAFTDTVVDEALNRKAQADKAFKEMDERFGSDKMTAEKK